MKKYLKKRGFTLIELIVVMAVLTILVLLAVPKYLEHTASAEMVHIKNDTKVVGDIIEEHLISENELPSDWTPIDIEAAKNENKLYSKEGRIKPETTIEGEFVEISSSFVAKKSSSRLTGTFVTDSNGIVYYINDKAVKLPAGDSQVCTIYDEASGDSINGDNLFAIDIYKIGDFEFTIEDGWGVKSNTITEYSGELAGHLDIPTCFTIGGDDHDVENIRDSVFAAELGVGESSMIASLEMVAAGISDGLTSIKLPNRLKSIGKNAFDGNQIESIKIPDSVEMIEREAFAWNPIREVYIGVDSNLSTVESGAFISAATLESVIIKGEQYVGSKWGIAGPSGDVQGISFFEDVWEQGR